MNIARVNAFSTKLAIGIKSAIQRRMQREKEQQLLTIFQCKDVFNQKSNREKKKSLIIVITIAIVGRVTTIKRAIEKRSNIG